MSYICLHLHNPCKPSKASWGGVTTCDECSVLQEKISSGSDEANNRSMEQNKMSCDDLSFDKFNASDYECKDVNAGNVVTGIKIYPDKKVFDQNDNFLGYGELIENKLIITPAPA
jgi:hypothetical protein